jgi:putative ABC transport system substrate-binding protein
MKRREFITLLGGTVIAWPLVARAQQSNRTRHIGVLIPFAETDPETESRIAALRQELQKLGWVEGRNVHVEYRWGTSDADSTRSLAKELVESQPDLILTVSTPVTAATLQLTHTIPIVFVQVGDPVGSGFAANFPQPGGNPTGFTNIPFTISGKWLDLLKEIAPSIVRVGALFNPATAPYAELFLNSLRAAAPSIGVEVIGSPVQDTSEIETVIAAFGRGPNGGLIVLPSSFMAVHRDMIVAVAARHRLPAIYAFKFFCASGGLICYGNDALDTFRHAAAYVDRILRGAKPADLPVQAPVKFELVINLKTAKSLGLDVPVFLQQRADDVIE